MRKRKVVNKMITHDEFIKSLPPERQARIKAMTEKLMAEEKPCGKSAKQGSIHKPPWPIC